jgi:4-hydroxybutyrate CoA-transferase
MSEIDLVAHLQSLPSGTKLVATPGCGAPSTLLAALGEAALRRHRGELHLYCGLLLDYPFLKALEAGGLQLHTWHLTGPLRRLANSTAVSFYPLRGGQVPRFLDAIRPEVALLRVGPPNEDGWCSFGASAGYGPRSVDVARHVIVEVDPRVPRTRGPAIHRSRTDLVVESRLPMPEYRRAAPDDVSRAVAREVIELLPDDPILQVGIGSISECVVDELVNQQLGGLSFLGMATDGMAEAWAKGLLRDGRGPAVHAAELMGTQVLMDFADDNPLLMMCTADEIVSPVPLQRFEHIVTINTALEIDLFGQVNAEWAEGRELSGIGGSVDFVEGALHSAGGKRIVAVASTSPRDGSSRIVSQLPAGTPVTHARHSAEFVVTEHGTAALAWKSDRERALALIAIAHPDHRKGLATAAGLT